jgi:hypothetical protein
MQAVIDDNNPIYVTDELPAAERRYRVRFYFDPNSIVMAGGDEHFLLYGYSGASTVVLRVELRYSLGRYQVRASLLDHDDDDSEWRNSSWFTISDASHILELDWQAATRVNARNGSLTLWIDGDSKSTLANIANGRWRIDRVRLGAVSGIDRGTRGRYYFDAFESRRRSYIGPVLDSQMSVSLQEEEAILAASQLYLPAIQVLSR